MPNAVDEMTERILDEAGIGPGMRVIDIGCGPGAVSLMLAWRVGDGGHVFAVDNNPGMLKAVQDRAREAAMSNISVVEGGFDAIVPGHGSLDAAVGRRVLMYQPDAVNAVTQLALAIRPGGIIAFHEHDTVTVSDSRALLPLHDQVRGWLRDMLHHEGANLNMGFDLHEALSAAGLVVERVRAEANLLTSTSDYPVAAIIQTVLPRLLAHGLVSEGEVDIETLDARLAAERRKANTTVAWEMVFCAWARKP